MRNEKFSCCLLTVFSLSVISFPALSLASFFSKKEKNDDEGSGNLECEWRSSLLEHFLCWFISSSKKFFLWDLQVFFGVFGMRRRNSYEVHQGVKRNLCEWEMFYETRFLSIQSAHKTFPNDFRESPREWLNLVWTCKVENPWTSQKCLKKIFADKKKEKKL